jgi:hypothetical protein
VSLCTPAYRAAYEILVEEALRRETVKHEALPEPQDCERRQIDLEDEIPL